MEERHGDHEKKLGKGTHFPGSSQWFTNPPGDNTEGTKWEYVDGK